MERIKAIGIKYIIATVITFSIYGIFLNASIMRLFWISIIVAGVTFLGDLFMLSKVGKVKALIADFGLFFLLYWGLSSLLIEGSMPIVFASLAAAFFSTISDAIFHIYMSEKVFQTDESVPHANSLQTEFAEEIDAQSIKKGDQTNRKKFK